MSADGGVGPGDAGGSAVSSDEVARRHRTDVRSLHREVRGDLDWITLKAMEKDRTRRYDTATGLAMDVRRHLDTEPVLARPPSAVYRTSTFVRRHRVGVTAAALVGLALVAGVIGTSAAMVRARHAEREAILQRNTAAHLLEDVTRARTAAQAQAARATAVSAFLQSVLASAQPDALGGGSDAKVADMLRSAERKIEAELADEPEAEVQTRFTLFRTYQSLGLWQESWPNLDRAYELVKQTHLEETEPGVRVTVAKAAFFLKRGLAHAQAEAIARSAAEPARRVFGEQHELSLLADGTLAFILATTREPAEQDTLFQPVIERFRRLSNSPATDATVAVALADYASMLSRRGEWSRAQSLCVEVLAFLKTRRRRDLPRELFTTLELVGTLRKQEKWAEAAEVYRSALADVRPQLSDAQPEVQTAMADYAYVLHHAGKEAESARVWRELMTFLNVAADSSATTPQALLSRGYIRARAGRFADGLADFHRVMEQDPSIEPAWWFRGCLLAYLGPQQEYEEHRRLMLDRFGVPNPLRLDKRAAKMVLLLPGGDVKRAEAIIDAALPTDAGRYLGWDQLTKAMAVYRTGRFRECLTWTHRAAGNLHNDAAKVTADLFTAMSHWQLGDHAQATRELDAVVAWVKQELPKANVEDSAFRHLLDNWLILHIILREANALIRPTPPVMQQGKAEPPRREERHAFL